MLSHLPPSGTDTRTTPADATSLAEAIEGAGMSTPATLALHIFKPLSWVGAQMLWVLQPFIEGIGLRSRRGPISVTRLAGFLEQESNVDRLITELDHKTSPER
jgi:hypothetical protein